jgi:hypothetical protein
MDVNWPQQLQNFGPFALLPFVVIVIERIAANRARDQKLPESIRNRVYAFAWILIFMLCVTVVVIWFMSRASKPSEAMMRGRITGLGSRQQLRASGPDTVNLRVFTYRNPLEPDQLFWRAFSTDPLDDTELAFVINTSTPEGSDKTYRFPFRAYKTFYNDSTELMFTYDSAKNVITFDNPMSHKSDELNGEPIVVVSNAPPTVEQAINQLPGFGVLFAQSSVRLPPAAVISNLESDDVLVRLTARRQLASIGPEATKAMDKALVGPPASSYRVKLGVIVAAVQMPNFRAESLSPAAWCEVWNASQASDDTLKTQASLLLKKQTTPVTASSCNARRLLAPQAVRPPVQLPARPPVQSTPRPPVR